MSKKRKDPPSSDLLSLQPDGILLHVTEFLLYHTDVLPLMNCSRRFKALDKPGGLYLHSQHDTGWKLLRWPRESFERSVFVLDGHTTGMSCYLAVQSTSRWLSDGTFLTSDYSPSGLLSQACKDQNGNFLWKISQENDTGHVRVYEDGLVHGYEHSLGMIDIFSKDLTMRFFSDTGKLASITSELLDYRYEFVWDLDGQLLRIEEIDDKRMQIEDLEGELPDPESLIPPSFRYALSLFMRPT